MHATHPERVVVVGAGLSGLAAALRLTGAGRAVTVLERESIPGGRAGRVEVGGYRFDTGPTVLTMPELIGAALADVGEDIVDWLTLRRLDPAYRARFADGSTLDVHADPVKMAEEIRQVCGAAEAAGYRRYVEYARRMYELQLEPFISRPLDRPVDLLRPELAQLIRRGGLRRLDRVAARFFADPRTRQLFTFQTLYAGVSPHQARALYAVISYLDTVRGVYYPHGGMHAVVEALAGAAVKHGAEIRVADPVTQIECRAGRAVAVHTSDGERLPADAVVVTTDLTVAYRDLLRRPVPGRIRRGRYAPSCVFLVVGSTRRYPGLAHHTIHFGADGPAAFAGLAAGRLPRDPSLLLSAPPDLAPADRAVYSVLVPTPNLSGELAGDDYRDVVLARLDALGYSNFADGIEAQLWLTPANWAHSGATLGTPFGLAHTFRQTGPFRPAARPSGLDNVVFAGANTHPGIGVPMVLLSGRLAADRLLGCATS